MNSVTIVALVARRELRERSRQRSFKLSTGFLALALLAVVIVPRFFDEDATSLQVGVVGPVPELVGSTLDGITAATGADISLEGIPDAAAGEARLTAGDLDLLVAGSEVVVDEEADPSSDLGQVTVALAQTLGLSASLSDAGLAPEAAAAVLDRGPAPVRSLAAVDEAGDRGDPQPLLIVGVILLYLALLTFGVAVTTGVVEEKTSRVVEVLLSAIRPHHLLAGKVLGIGILGLAQLVMVATPALVVATATGTDLPSGSALTVASLVLWFVLGYALYSCAYAAAGSLVSRLEEVNNTTFPVTFLLVLAYVGSIFVGGAPDSGVARFLALFPPTAPLAMPARAAMGDTALWEVPLAVLLTLAAAYGLIRLAGRIYTGSVLRFGPKVKVRQALRS